MKENGAKRIVADILRSSMKGLMESDVDSYQRIVSLADTGFFEQHQSAGRLRALADKLLAVPMEGGTEGGKDDEDN
jgi:hypothetical protein